MRKLHRMKLWMGVLLALVLSLPAGALIKSPPEKGLLPNGLRVIVMEDRSLPVVTGLLLFNVGYSSPFTGAGGLPAILSELQRQSDTESSSRFDLNARLDAIGADMEYGVSPWGLTLGLQAGPEDLDAVLQTLRALGFGLKPTQADLDRARQSVGRRVTESLAFPLAGGYLEKQAIKSLYPDTSLAHAVWFDADHLAGIDLAAIRKFQDGRMVPNNAVLVITGAVEPSSAFRKSMEVFGALPALPLTAEPTLGERPVAAKKVERREYLDIKTTQVLVAFEAPSLCDDDSPVARLWETALSGANDSWLQRLVEREYPELRNPFVRYRPLQNQGVMLLGFETAEPEIDRVVSGFLAQLSTVYQNPPRGEELQRLINLQRTQISHSHETRMSFAGELAAAELAKSFTYTTGMMASLQRVSPEDLARVAKQIFGENRYVIQVAYPVACKVTAEAKPKMEKLPNGLQLLVKPYAAGELVGICCHVMLPDAGDESGRRLNAGAVLLSTLLNSGAQTALRRELDKIGGSVTIQGNPRGLQIVGSAERSQVVTLATLMRRIMVEETWPAPQFDRARNELIGELATSRDLMYFQVVDAFQKEAYGNLLPLGALPEEADLKALKPADLAGIRQQIFSGANLACVVTGNFDTETVFDQLKPVWSALPAGTLFPSPEPPAAVQGPFAETKVIDLALQDPSKGAFLGVAYRLPPLGKLWGKGETQNDFGAISVVFHLMTWSRNGRLIRALQDKGLLEEMVYHQFQATRDASYILCLLRVPKDRHEEARQELEKVLADLPNLAVTEKDIRNAGRAVQTHFLLAMEKSADQARVLASFLGIGLGASFFESLHDLYDNVTVDQVKKTLDGFFKHPLIIKGLAR